jgi:3-oxoacyl-[acyl-carrier-protein] synthase-3
MHIINGVKIAGISTRYPSKIEKTDDYVHFNQEEADKFKKNVGIVERRIVSGNTCASDLCEAACRDLMSGLDWNGDDVDLLIMITQTGDYPVPATSIILQNKLGIKQSCICFDVNLGCSSFPYGLFIVSNLLQSAHLKKAVLLIGDVSSKVCSISDKSAYPLFGDAGCAIALIKTAEKSEFIFDLKSDGAGWDAIMIKSGGLASRYPVKSSSFQREDGSEIVRDDVNLSLKGADIFSFAISQVPLSLLSVANQSSGGIDKFDFMVLHQANKMINQQIVRKTKIEATKSLESLELYGNTSSASIPLTITANKEKIVGSERSIIASGFGVGLSWGSVSFNLSQDVFMSHLEYK